MIKKASEDGESTRELVGDGKTRKEFILLSGVIDRLSFVVYSTITFILLACFC